MPAVSPVSDMANAAQGMKNLVAHSATFQAATKSANDEEAIKFVRLVRVLPAELGYYSLPFCLIEDPKLSYIHRKAGLAEGTIVFRLEFETSPENRGENDDAAIEAYNFFGGVADDVAVLGRGATTIDPNVRVGRLDLQDQLFRALDEDPEGRDVWAARFQVDYGTR